ncbi:MAG TPA: hypothetical protein VN739_07385 [Nitrososphaerales archaeon]|nr:hypothetical protein [Nitrososphaerales archaeon]
MSSILTGNSSWISTIIYLVFVLLAVLGVVYLVYWAARSGTRRAIREELSKEPKADKV